MNRQDGFTVIELLVVLAAMAVLLSLAAPRYVAQLDGARETALRHNLKAMREAIDQFRADRGAAPTSLQDLVAARYLREVPEDPITQRRDSWVLLGPGNRARDAISADSAPVKIDAGSTAAPIADVRSGAPGKARDGTPYAGW